MLVLTSLLIVCQGAYLKYEILMPAGLFQEKGLIEVPFAAMKDPVAQFVLKNLKEQKPEPELPQSQEETTVATLAPTEVVRPIQETEISTTMPIEIPTVPPTEISTEPIIITESWFDDVLFVGDSRTVGLRDYARLGKADYFCSVGMSVFKVMEESAEDVNFPKMKLQQLLKEKKYNKIYISLGLNDCGAPYELLMDGYHSVVQTVRQLQPDAVIILQSMITLSRKKAASEWYFSLENLQIVNAGIRDFANGNTIHYIDANTHFADEEGYLPSDRSFDGCHFYIDGYQEWAQWILDNAKTLNISFG